MAKQTQQVAVTVSREIFSSSEVG